MAWHDLSIESEALRGNPLGDPATRPLFVWTPPAYDRDAARRFRSVYVLQGLTGQVRAWFNVSPFTKGFPELLEDARVDAVVVLVDAFTALGGSQFVDSAAIGGYGTYLCDEIVPFVDERFRTLAEPAHRGIAGKSSGGFGAMVWGLLRPDLFGGFATHAGDALFDVSLAHDFAPAAQALRNDYDGSYDRFWADFRSGRPPFEKKNDAVLLAVYAAAAAYSPREDGSVELPFRIDTGELVTETWERWLAWTRFGSRRRTRTPSEPPAGSGSTPAGTTSTSSTSARRRSATRCWPRVRATRTSGSSSSTARTGTRRGATRSAWPSWSSDSLNAQLTGARRPRRR